MRNGMKKERNMIRMKKGDEECKKWKGTRNNVKRR
jgi:hypothetical protein